jgi:hypothetical protein
VEIHHYPLDVFNLLVATIPLLCKSKKDVVAFFEGAGVNRGDIEEVAGRLRSNPASVSKFEIARCVLSKANERGDSGLRARREIIKRVVEFEAFSTCWPDDQLKAKGLVSDLCKAVNVKDSFTRMNKEREAERARACEVQRAEIVSVARQREKIEEVSSRLSALFAMNDEPQERGLRLEGVLNDLFETYGIQVREGFQRRCSDTNMVDEQIDGVIQLDGNLYLVEMKWLNAPVGTAAFSPHLTRLLLRSDARGIFISASGYTQSVINTCVSALGQKTIFLCTLEELVMLLHRRADLVGFLKTKANAALLEKNPFLKILS